MAVSPCRYVPFVASPERGDPMLRGAADGESDDDDESDDGIEDMEAIDSVYG